MSRLRAPLFLLPSLFLAASCLEPVSAAGDLPPGEEAPDAAEVAPGPDATTGEPPDASQAADGGDTDGGSTVPDGGSTVPDGGSTTTDGGSTTTDGGSTTTDGGSTTTDGGSTTTDGGSTVTDGGSTVTDGGSTVTDGGSTVTDGGSGCVDNDGDWYGVGPKCLGLDCDDTNANVNPGRTETCDGVDNNCNGRVDEVPTTSCTTACGTGTAACVNGQMVCSAKQPRPETCDGTDEDCDGVVDDGVTRACSTACGAGVQICSRGVYGTCTAKAPEAEVCADATDNDCNGQVDEGCATLAGVFVSGTTGSDLNTGTQASPVATIARGLALATATAQAKVYVAAATYKEDLTLVEGVSLFGGWNTAFTKRDLTANASVIECQAQNALGDAPGLVVPANVTAATVLDGFSIRGRNLSVGTSSALSVSGSPTLSALSVLGGTGNKSFGLNLASGGVGTVAQPVVHDSKISSADALGASGVSAAINCSGALLSVDGSTLTGGRARSGTTTPNRSFALRADNCRLTVTASQLAAGADVDEASAIGASNSQLFLSGSVVDGAGLAAGGSSGATLVNGSTATIVKSTLKAGIGCFGQGGYGLALVGSAADVDASVIVGASNSTNSRQCTTAGVYAEHSAPRVVNSVVFGGEGGTAMGVSIVANATSGEFELTNDYVNGGSKSGITGSISRGIDLNADASGVPARGIIRNDLVHGGSGQAAASGVREQYLRDGTCALQPRLLENNDLYRSSGTGALYVRCVAYRQPQLLNTANAVNGLTAPPAASNNISADPKLVSETVGAANAFHLKDTTSPAYNAGTATGAPATDLDGEARPKAGAVDIGPDEL